MQQTLLAMAFLYVLKKYEKTYKIFMKYKFNEWKYIHYYLSH